MAIDMQERMQELHYTMLGLFSLLFVYTTYCYGVKGVWSLESRRFHGFMFVLIETFALFWIFSLAFFIAYFNGNPTWPSESGNRIILGLVGYYFNIIALLLNNIVHVFYVIKFWIVSKKIDLHVNRLEGSDLGCKVRALTWALVFFCCLPFALIFVAT